MTASTFPTSQLFCYRPTSVHGITYGQIDPILPSFVLLDILESFRFLLSLISAAWAQHTHATSLFWCWLRSFWHATICRGNMCYPDGGLGFVHMLPARPAGAVCIGFYILFSDVYFNSSSTSASPQRRQGGMPSSEESNGEAHKPVHSPRSLISVRICSFNGMSADLIPSSPSSIFKTLYENCRSAQRVHAKQHKRQSCATVPPAPECEHQSR